MIREKDLAIPDVLTYTVSKNVLIESQVFFILMTSTSTTRLPNFNQSVSHTAN